MNVLADPVRILIVDDSEDQLLLLRRYFERAGCEVSSAVTAAEALDSVALRAPDLAVIDLVLPGMDGWELATHITREYPDCAIAITSVLSPDMYPAMLPAMPKPVTSEHVRGTLKALVPRWEAA